MLRNYPRARAVVIATLALVVCSFVLPVAAKSNATVAQPNKLQSSTPNIYGRITDFSGISLADVTVTLVIKHENEPDQILVTQTNADGVYGFYNLSAATSFWVTPSKSGFVFNPSSQASASTRAFTPDNLRLDFQGAVEGYGRTISGQVRDVNGDPFPGAVIRIVNSSGTLRGDRVSDNEGNFAFENLPPGDTYTLTTTYPSNPNIVFVPSPVRFNNLMFNVRAVITQGVRVTGRIVDVNGAGVSGASVRFLSLRFGTQVTTTNTGDFSVLLGGGDTYQVSPSKANTHFDPSIITLNQLREPQRLDFVARPGATYSITGRVTYGGNPISAGGITINLGGTQVGRTSTDANGNYRFDHLRAGGTFTVTGVLSRGNVKPNAYDVSSLDGNQIFNFTITKRRLLMRRMKN